MVALNQPDINKQSQTCVKCQSPFLHHVKAVIKVRVPLSSGVGLAALNSRSTNQDIFLAVTSLYSFLNSTPFSPSKWKSILRKEPSFGSATSSERPLCFYCRRGIRLNLENLLEDSGWGKKLPRPSHCTESCRFLGPPTPLETDGTRTPVQRASLWCGLRMLCFFYSLMACGSPVSGKSFGATFPTAFARFVRRGHILVILETLLILFVSVFVIAICDQ